MRRRNLPDGGYGKVISMCSRDLPTRRREKVTQRRGGDVPQQLFWMFYLGGYRRRRRDVLMGRRGYVSLKRLGNVPLGRCWVFHWDLFETSWRRTDGTSLLRPFETSLRRSNKTSWRRTTEMSWQRSFETSLGVSFGTYLRRRWDTQRDVVTT